MLGLPVAHSLAPGVLAELDPSLPVSLEPPVSSWQFLLPNRACGFLECHPDPWGGLAGKTCLLPHPVAAQA